MTRKEKSNGHQTETPDVSHIRNPEVEHETSDVNVRGVMTFVVVLTIATIAIAIGLRVLFGFFDSLEAKEQPRSGPMALRPGDEQRLPPEPRLQSSKGFAVTLENGERKSLELSIPQAEFLELRRQWENNLQTGGKDQSGKVVGMPIDAAIEKIASQGLPSSVTDPTRKFQDFAITIPTAASSGREGERIQ